MRLTVFGATGGIGTQVVKQALARDHDVTAVVRDPARLAVPPAAGLTASVMDAAASALSPRRGGPPNILGDSMRAILSAMNATSTKRLVAVSASGFLVEEGEGFLTGKIAKLLLRATKRKRGAVG